MNLVIAHFLDKLSDVFRNSGGVFSALLLIVCSYFAGHAFVCFLVLAVTLMDAVWGIAVSIKNKNFVLSELGRQTIAKFAVYGCAMFVFVGLDHFVDSTISASVIGALIVLVEFWSSAASMTILFPDMLFLSVLRKALKGEIARKLNCDEEAVDDLLKSKSNG